MKLPFGDVLWSPVGRCLRLAHGEAGELLGHRADALVDVTPEPGCDCRVAELAGGKVIGNAKLAATADDAVIGDVQFLYGTADPDDHWVLAQRRFRLPQRLAGTAALLAASNAENYYHWLFDSLPRLHLLRMAGYPLDGIDHFLLDDSERAFQAESLERLGIPEAKLWRCSKRRVLACDRLLLPSMPGPVGYPPRWLCELLRRSFVTARHGDAPRRKVYISRQHARGRKILNEADILPDLARRGYEVVHAERLGFAQQVELFASAREIVAMHGAGLSNIVFAPRGARVLELGSPLHHNLSFRTVAANCDLVHDHLVLDVAPGAAGGDTRFGNVVVDAAAFAHKLETFSAPA